MGGLSMALAAGAGLGDDGWFVWWYAWRLIDGRR